MSITKRPDGRWRARYRDAAGKEHARHFARKLDGQRWLDEVTSSVVSGTYTDPKTARTTVGEWCETWLAGYATRRASTVRQARDHVAQIVAEFGTMPLSAVRPSHVRSWTSRLRAEPLEASYVYALHSRLAQIMADAVHDGIIPRSPCSRRTSPGAGKQRPYLASTEQVWALHDAMPEYLRAAILLGAFAGLRIAEACGLRVADVDFMRGVISPAVQYPAGELKTEISKTSIPVPRSLALELAAHVQQHPGETLLTSPRGQLEPWRLERAIRTARGKVDGLPVPRPAALPRVAPDRLRRRRKDRAGAAAARVGQDHARHLRPPVARPGRVHPRGHRRGFPGAPGKSCGLCAD
jgi:integrase